MNFRKTLVSLLTPLIMAGCAATISDVKPAEPDQKAQVEFCQPEEVIKRRITTLKCKTVANVSYNRPKDDSVDARCKVYKVGTVVMFQPANEKYTTGIEFNMEKMHFEVLVLGPYKNGEIGPIPTVNCIVKNGGTKCNYGGELFPEDKERSYADPFNYGDRRAEFGKVPPCTLVHKIKDQKSQLYLAARCNNQLQKEQKAEGVAPYSMKLMKFVVDTLKRGLPNQCSPESI